MHILYCKIMKILILCRLLCVEWDVHSYVTRTICSTWFSASFVLIVVYVTTEFVYLLYFVTEIFVLLKTRTILLHSLSCWLGGRHCCVILLKYLLNFGHWPKHKFFTKRLSLIHLLCFNLTLFYSSHNCDMCCLRCLCAMLYNMFFSY